RSNPAPRADSRHASPTDTTEVPTMDAVRRCHPTLWSLVVSSLLFAHVRLSAAERPSAAETAARVDAALTRGLAPDARLPAAVDDETFLRRVSLDLTGKLPSPDALRRFTADRPAARVPAADKRAKVIDELLNGDPYAVNWGRYWRDALTYHTP